MFTNIIKAQKKQKNRKIDVSSVNFLNQLKILYTNSYSIGVEIGDVSIQENALIGLLAIDRMDSLSIRKLLDFYFVNNNYNKAFLLTKKYLEIKKNNIEFLDFYAKSAEMIGKFSDSKIGYQKLYIFTNDTYYAYLYAFSEYSLKNLNESLNIIKELENNEDTKNRYIAFNLDNNKSQDIVIRAALQYLRGIILKEQGNLSDSKKSFENALKIQPDFEIVKKLVNTN